MSKSLTVLASGRPIPLAAMIALAIVPQLTSAQSRTTQSRNELGIDQAYLVGWEPGLAAVVNRQVSIRSTRISRRRLIATEVRVAVIDRRTGSTSHANLTTGLGLSYRQRPMGEDFTNAFGRFATISLIGSRAKYALSKKNTNLFGATASIGQRVQLGTRGLRIELLFNYEGGRRSPDTGETIPQRLGIGTRAGFSLFR